MNSTDLMFQVIGASILPAIILVIAVKRGRRVTPGGVVFTSFVVAVWISAVYHILN